jgi:putative ABC transport system ATP-binding protein
LKTQPIITLRDVRLQLGEGVSRVQVLDGIDLSVGQGESIAILGPSGSGKSTLLMVIAGLEQIDAGSINVAGTELANMSEDGLAAFRGRNIGIIFQSFHLIANMTAIENVAVPLELAGVTGAFDKAAAELEAVGLGERLRHYPGQLSGGEQQRVAIARALAPDPPILVADEPTGNLDAETGAHIADMLYTKQAERDMTLVLVTHDPALANRCDRTLRVRGGRMENSPSSRPAGSRGVAAAGAEG